MSFRKKVCKISTKSTLTKEFSIQRNMTVPCPSLLLLLPALFVRAERLYDAKLIIVLWLSGISTR